MATVFKNLMIGFLSFSSLANYAATVTQVNRYATIENKPLAAQINPLLAIQQVHFPHEIQTVGQAITYWLRYCGFHLAPTSKQSEHLKMIMTQPLPQINRHLGPLSIKDGLEVLVGKSVFTLINNPISREVNFKTNPTFLTAKKPAGK